MEPDDAGALLTKLKSWSPLVHDHANQFSTEIDRALREKHRSVLAYIADAVRIVLRNDPHPEIISFLETNSTWHLIWEFSEGSSCVSALLFILLNDPAKRRQVERLFSPLLEGSGGRPPHAEIKEG